MSLKDTYTIKPITYQEAMDIVVANHYLHRRAPCSKAYGLIDKDNNIKGVVVYGVPPSSTLLKGVCGEEEKHNVYELTRLWIDDSVAKNGESYLIGNTIKLLDKEIIVSFSEIKQGHRGVVYQASNFIYCGLSSKFKDPKVKGLEHQHHATYAHGLTNKQVEEKFGVDNVYYVDRPRKHRYIYFNATSKKRKNELISKLRYKVQPYPKE
jgi:hypothetical protein